MKPQTFQAVEKTLRAAGFTVERSSGSHFIWTNALNGRTVVVPHHSGLLPVGTLLSIYRQAGLRRP